jgi:4-hydroxy-tetrahydrodipicolinate reductase
MKTEVIILGAAGRMGKQLVTAVQENPDTSLIGAVEVPGHPQLGRDAGECAGIGHIGILLSDSLESVLKINSVVIDFSQPQATLKHAKIVETAGAKSVIGTTGLTDDQISELKRISKTVGIVFAPNMSVGMNLLFKLTCDVARILGPEYDIEIIEAHHHFKKDAPSGSAKKLAEMAALGRSLDLNSSGVYGRNGITGERKPNEIGVHAVRAGDIVGDHTVLFGGTGERLELKHVAHNRDTFAKSAVRAAIWLSKQNSGFFDMLDVLGIR